MRSQLIGPRDMRVLTILAEMYGAPMDRVASMLGVSIKSAYRYTAKWRAAHLVSNLKMRPVPGPTWVFLTRAAVEALLPFYARFWTPSPKMAAHVVTVLDVRLALVGQDLNLWISERQLRAEQDRPKAGGRRGHVHDGRYYRPDGSLWAVEVELTAKNDAAAKLAVARAKEAARIGGCEKVIYYCRTPEIRAVIKKAALATQAVDGPPIRVADLSEVLPDKTAKATESGPVRPGLTVIEGGASDHGVPDASTGKAVSS
ncbi:hypothetical protein [Nocardia altamirensis]|uniref:hypothetical protein n=1 Tax=Nocardia altamirensis TaxID=472158 RepID=UPI00114CE8CE|nr:hypothetical protein [Nocardia altamirensis]